MCLRPELGLLERVQVVPTFGLPVASLSPSGRGCIDLNQPGPRRQVATDCRSRLYRRAPRLHGVPGWIFIGKTHYHAVGEAKDGYCYHDGQRPFPKWYRRSLPAMRTPQPHPSPAAVLGDEIDAGGLESGTEADGFR
jgi:hypothetical protein